MSGIAESLSPVPSVVPAVAGDEDGLRPLSELRSSGLLWLINRVCLHPRGFALALGIDAAGEVIGWRLVGRGDEPWTYAPEIDEDVAFKAVEALLADTRVVS